MLEYLVAAGVGDVGGLTLDIAGPDTLTYGAMIRRIADLMLVRRPAVRLGFTQTPWTSAVAARITGEQLALVRPLMDSLDGDLIADDATAREKLAVRLGAQAMRLADVPARLHEFDIVVSCTASTLPIIGLGAVERALKARRHKPMFMLDLAVPRDIEAEVAKLSDIYLYTVDDLSALVQTAGQKREAAVAQAEAIIENVKTEISAVHGDVTQVNNLGKREFARVIDRKFTSGTYVHVSFSAPAEGPAQLKERLRLNHNVYRTFIESV